MADCLKGNQKIRQMMFSFTDMSCNEWHLRLPRLQRIETNCRVCKLYKYFNPSDTLILNKVMAAELAVRLAFFAEHGRLPTEKPVKEDSES